MQKGAVYNFCAIAYNFCVILVATSRLGDPTISMMTFVLNSLVSLHKDQEGQGLVEYLLILALVAFAATAGMGSLASYLNVAFSDVGSMLNKYIS